MNNKQNSMKSFLVQLRPTTIWVWAAVVLLVLGVDALGQDGSMSPADTFGGAEISPLVSFLGGLHPLSTHFPLALAFAASLFETVFIISSNKTWSSTAFHCLSLGATLALFTAIAGLMAAEAGPFFGEDAQTLDFHRLMGLISVGLLLLTVFLGSKVRQGQKPNWLWLYRGAMALTTIGVFVAGHFGSKLAGSSPF